MAEHKVNVKIAAIKLALNSQTCYDRVIDTAIGDLELLSAIDTVFELCRINYRGDG